MSGWPIGLCSDDPAWPALDRPLLVDGKVVCTDGRVLVRVDAVGVDCEEAPEGIATVVADIFGRTLTGPTFDMDALRKWCGPAENECTDCTAEDRARGCTACDGTGYTDCHCLDCGDYHERPCPDCHGKGGPYCRTCENEGILNRYTQDRRGEIAGIPFSKRLMAAVLDGAPGERVTIGIPEKPYHALTITGDGWEGFVMPMRRLDDKEVEYDPVDGLALERAS